MSTIVISEKTAPCISLCDDAPQIYVACLAAYNNGHLYGCWIDATQDLDDIHIEIQQMLRASPLPSAEEWEIHDTSGFYPYLVNPHTGIEVLNNVAQTIAQYGKIAAELANQFEINVIPEILELNYQGQYDSELDFSKMLFDDLYSHDVPDFIKGYINYEAFSRDVFIDSYFSINIDHEAHVFSNY